MCGSKPVLFGRHFVRDYRRIVAHRRRALRPRAVDQLLHGSRGTSVKNVVLARREIEAWARDLQPAVALHGPERIGQSYCMFAKLDWMSNV
jgi:hypothetical protein